MPSDVSVPGPDTAPDPATCELVADDLAALVEGAAVPPMVDAHLATCLRCQAEAARYRRLGSLLRSLRVAPVPVAPDLEARLLGALDATESRVGRRLVALAVTAGGVLVGVAGAVAVASRRRAVARLAV